MNWRRWWLPSVGAWLWLLLFLGVQVSPRRAELLNDGDPCWHWLQGDWMLKHGTVLRTDFWSHTRPGAQLICKDWISDILWAVAGNMFGWSGVIFLTAGLIATTLWLLYRQLQKEGTDVLLAAGLTLLAGWACSLHWIARPLLMTHMLVVLVAWVLRDFDRERVSPWQTGWRLAALMAVWANVHGAFFTGIVMVGLYALGEGVRLVFCAPTDRAKTAQKLRILTVLAVVAMAASLLNPNGWRLHAHILGFLRTSTLAFSTDEWLSPDFHSATTRGFTALLLVLLLTVVAVRPRLSPTDAVVAVGWGFLALNASRNVAIFALVVTPILAECLTPALREVRGGRWVQTMDRLSVQVGTVDRTAGGAAVVALVIAGTLLALANPKLVGGSAILATELSDRDWPVAAVKFVRANSSTVRGPMFNEYIWGGYLAQQLTDRKVFIDGRNDFYGMELVREYSEVSQLQPDWEVVLQKYGVGWTILPRVHQLNQVLALHPQWQIAHTDAVATVYCRRSL